MEAMGAVMEPLAISDVVAPVRQGLGVFDAAVFVEQRTEYVPALSQWRPRWGNVYEERATPAQWKKLVQGMSKVQKTVHLAGRWVADDRKELAGRLFREGRETYRQSLQNEVNRLGCGGHKALVPAAGPELKALRERADWAAGSVGGTYNLNLARAILHIGETTPTANRHVYAHRLFYGQDAWDKKYWDAKSVEISQVETMTSVNAGVADFYARNGDIIMPKAVVRPYVAVCPICIEMVAGNPYDSVDEVFRQWELPAHINCPHFCDVLVEGRRLTRDECSRLWVGQ